MHHFFARVAPSAVVLLLGVSAGCGDSDSDDSDAPTGAGGQSGGGQGGENQGGAELGDDEEVPSLVVSETEAIASFPTCGFDGEAPAVVVLDDFEEGLAMTGDPGGGHWFRLDDGSGGTLTLETEGSADESEYLKVNASGFSTWATFGLTFGSALGAEQACALSAEGFEGVRFRARGQGALRLRLSAAEQLSPVDGGACTDGESCYDLPGAWVHLREEWTEVELPFCGLRVEGWGGRLKSADPSQLVNISFVVQSFAQTGDFELFLDDVELYDESEARVEDGCDVGCPQRSVPEPSNITPETTNLDTSGPLSLATFEQETESCGAITRRYLTYVPETLQEGSDAPVVIALHGYGTSAEGFRDFQTRGTFERLADEDGFIVVYGNGAPSVGSSPDPFAPNAGTFRQAENDDLQVDDVDYLRRVLEDLVERGITSGQNDVFLTGLSNGGGMTLLAAERAPELFSGVAPFMPFVGSQVPPPSPPSDPGGLTHLMLVHSTGDPGLPPNHDALLAELPAIWGAALGLSGDDLQGATETPLENAVVEGEDYEGSAPVVLATRDSSVTRTDFASSTSDAHVRVLTIEGGGHFWPHPVQDEQAFILERWGLRNQDFDGAEAAWEFFKSR